MPILFGKKICKIDILFYMTIAKNHIEIIVREIIKEGFLKKLKSK